VSSVFVAAMACFRKHTSIYFSVNIGLHLSILAGGALDQNLIDGCKVC
jgi:hypothetical protein